MKRPHPLWWLAVALACSHSFAASLTWTNRMPPPISPLNTVKFVENQFVAVGSLGGFWTSPDGTVWTSHDTGTFNSLNGVTGGGNVTVAFGNALTIAAFDFAGNERLKSGSVDNLTSGTYGQGRFVVVGGSAILTSANGSTWVRIPLPVPLSINFSVTTVVYGDGKFVLAGRSINPGPVSGAVLTSSDGITWTNDASPSPVFSSMTYGNGTYMGITGGANDFVYTSTDAVTWTEHEIDVQLDAPPIFRRVTYDNGMFLLVGYITDDTNSGLILASADGNTWENWSPPSIPALNSIAFGNGTFVAVGGGSPGGSGFILQSSSVAAGQLSAERLQPDGFKIKVLGEVGRSYKLQSASGVSGTMWSNILGFTLGQATTNYVDAQATNQPKLFYRLTSP